jgi:hypothetical protein
MCLFAILIWQKSCFLNIENMKTANGLPSDQSEQRMPGDWPRLGPI